MALCHGSSAHRGEPRRTSVSLSTRQPTTSALHRSGRRACSSSVGNRCPAPAVKVTSTSRTCVRLASGRSRIASCAPQPGQTAPSMSKGRRGSTSAASYAERRSSTSRAARSRQALPARSSSARESAVRAGDRSCRAERCDGQRHPAQRPRRWARDRVLLEPDRDGRGPRRLGRQTRVA